MQRFDEENRTEKMPESDFFPMRIFGAVQNGKKPVFSMLFPQKFKRG